MRRLHALEEPRSPLEEARVHLMAYGPDELEEVRGEDLEGMDALLAEHSVVWVNIVGTGDHELLAQLGERFQLHPLVVEDLENTRQRPKVEDYEDITYTVTRLPTLTPNTVETEQVSLLLGDRVVVTVQESPGDVWDGVRDRLRRGRPRIRGAGPDYLLYALLDAVVDAYFPILESMGERVEELEEGVLESLDEDVLEEIHGLKRQLALLRRLVWPQRDALGSLERGEHPRVQSSTRTFLRDVYDHASSILETLEVYRELAGGVRDLYLNQVSQRTNEAMRVLTVVATIFIPLTFLAGIWGMNFENMPELALRWAYPAVLATMAIIAGLQLVYFQRRGWI